MPLEVSSSAFPSRNCHCVGQAAHSVQHTLHSLQEARSSGERTANMASSIAPLILAILALFNFVFATNFSNLATSVASSNATAPTNLTVGTNFTAPDNSTHSHAKCNPRTGPCPTKNNPYGLEFFPVIHFGPVPAPTICFNQGPEQLHVSGADPPYAQALISISRPG